MCFFSATLHSPAITKLASEICSNPTWVDLKGKDAIPECVHHVVVRVNPNSHGAMRVRGQTVLDNVHLPNCNDAKEISSKRMKELKQQILLEIIDKFEV